MNYLALLAEIQANPACAPYIHTNDMPKLGGAEAAAKDQAIADIINVGRVRRVSHMITERGVRESLSIRDAALFLKALRDLSSAVEMPVGIGAVLTQMGVNANEHWAYLDALQCGWSWLKGDGLDLGSAKVSELLQLIAAGLPETATACTELSKKALVPDPVCSADVSRAVRGPWE